LLKGSVRKEGIDYEGTFAPLACLEEIRILLAFSVAKGFKLHKMNVKSPFLNGVLEEEVYVRQLRTMCGSRTGGWSLPCVMSD
jgi:hypothetical protein